MANIHLTLPEVKEVRRRAWLGETIRDISDDTGHTYSVVWNAVRGKSWSTVHNPPPVPTGHEPVAFRVCVNEHCGDLYQGYPHNGLCQACYSYKWRNDGEMRRPGAIPIGRKPMDIGDLDALYERYLQGESTNDIAEDLDCSAETLRRRFRLGDYEMRDNTEFHRQLTEAEVVQARVMHYEDGMPINEVADYLDQEYMTVYSAVRWHTWRTAGGPGPDSEDSDEMHPCEECGVLTSHALCRYCRVEMRQYA